MENEINKSLYKLEYSHFWSLNTKEWKWNNWIPPKHEDYFKFSSEILKIQKKF